MENQITGYNLTFPIYNADGTPFYDLVLRKATYDSVVMSLGDKITGDVYYKDNTLVFAMTEYIVFEGVKYVLVNPPTVVREGMVANNSDAKGMTKYSFEFYHPMYNLSNLPFTDVAVSDDEKKYLSQNRTFSWIGCLYDPTKSGLVEKLNKNLEETLWQVNVSSDAGSLEKMAVIPEDVLAFDKQTIADVLKTIYDTWEVPFVISTLNAPDANGKQYFITFGMPTDQVLDENGKAFTFQFGKGVGLKNNSRTPKNNKIVTRLAGQGSTSNIPFGYPQIEWTGNEEWEYTINNDKNDPNSYPIYNGIVAGQPKRLIKHPFTRSNLMPSIYAETVNKKVNPNAADYNPSIEIKDYYDAPSNYPNPIDPQSPSYEFHEFEDIKPQLGERRILDCVPYNQETQDAISLEDFVKFVRNKIDSTTERSVQKALLKLLDDVENFYADSLEYTENGGSYTFSYKIESDEYYYYVTYTSSNVNFEKTVLKSEEPVPKWDDTMDDDGNYNQSYFKLTLPQLDFDLYASASVTEEMKINMRSGACIGCTFGVYVDWEDYKANFYDSDGNFAPNNYYDKDNNPDGNRHLDKYPNSKDGSITVICKKDLETFGTLMPNIYQQPKGETQEGADDGDEFVLIGISMPLTYISNAENELDEAMMEYILENNMYYYEYPLTFDEFFLATHLNILAQIKNNVAISFKYAKNDPITLFVKQITIKFGEKVLPQYSITLSDDIEIVLNKIGQVTDDVSRMRVQVSELQNYYTGSIVGDIQNKLSRIEDDVCEGRISFQQGLDAIGKVVFSDEMRSNNFETGLYDGRGWRIDHLGNGEFESMRVRSYLEVVELLINRLQAQEGDTMFSDNDQIDSVDKYVDPNDNSVSYVLSLKEKYDGYVTSQQYGNILKGIINTLAAKQAGVSDESGVSVEVDGANKYYTSWCRVIDTHNTNSNLGVNQIRVVLYSDTEVPAGRNFEPCELMTIARWGCVDYSDPNDANYETIKASIQRRQRMFMISTTEGRVVKYTGVDSPKLLNGNYGVTIGELPEFVKSYTDVKPILDQVGEHTDWLYAQGIVVGNFVKVSKEGLPVPMTVYCGEWVDGSKVSQPTAGNGIYYYNQYNEDTQQNETHIVSHKGCQWQCLQSQPVVSGHTARYYEPQLDSSYWRLVSYSTTYELYPSFNQINVQRTDSGGYSPETVTLTCGYKKKTGDLTPTIVSDVTSRFDGYNIYFSMRTRQKSAWGNYYLYTNDTYKAYLTSLDVARYDCVEFVICKGTLAYYPNIWYMSDVIDRNTVPIVSDGTKGENGEDGKDGAQGKIGRMYYYAREWANVGRISYTVSDIEAPFFKYNDNYWVFNPEENGTYTMAQMGAPSSSNANWQIMTSDFKYLITEAIFSNFAKFGSFIISGDWLISTNGTIGGVAKTNGESVNGKPAYTYFDASHPNDDTGTNFIPNYCVDGRKGASYQNDAYLRGKLDAKSLMISFADVTSLSTFIVGVDTIVNGKDITGTWNFMVAGQDIFLPINQYAYVGQRVTLYNPHYSYCGTTMTNVMVGEYDGALTSTRGYYLRGYAKPKSGSVMQPVTIDANDPVTKISFINGCIELMCVPSLTPKSGQLCDWCIINIGTNFFDLETDAD